MSDSDVTVLKLIYFLFVWQIKSQWTEIWFEDGIDGSEWTYNSRTYFNYDNPSYPGCFTGSCILCWAVDGTHAWMYRNTEITAYSHLRLRYDLAVDDMEPGDVCNIYYAYDSITQKTLITTIDPDTEEWIYYPDQYLTLPSALGHTTLWIWFESNTATASKYDGCYWDNIYLQGVLTGYTASPTPPQTKQPTSDPTAEPTYTTKQATSNPTVEPSHTTKLSTSNPTAEPSYTTKLSTSNPTTERTFTIATTIDTLKTTEELKDKDVILTILLFGNVIIAVVIVIVLLVICIYFFWNRHRQYQMNTVKTVEEVSIGNVSLERARSNSGSGDDIVPGVIVERVHDQPISYSKCNQCGAESKENVEGVFVCMLCKSLDNDDDDDDVNKMYDANMKTQSYDVPTKGIATQEGSTDGRKESMDYCTQIK